MTTSAEVTSRPCRVPQVSPVEGQVPLHDNGRHEGGNEKGETLRPAGRPEEVAMSAEQRDNKEIVRRFYEAVDRGQVEALDEFIAADCVDRDPPPVPGLAQGLEGFRQSFR